MKTVLGNSYLTSIAYKAKSPTQAAKLATQHGCTPDQIRAVHNAAVFKRDNGEEAFLKEFSPFDPVDIDNQRCKTMTLRLGIDKKYVKRPLNTREFNEVADFIESELSKFGITARIERKETHPHVHSAIKIVKD